MKQEIDADTIKRIQADLMDGFDEELEMELEDRTELGQSGEERISEDRAYRPHYFRELFKLQTELVILQDWVVHSGHKVVILFEGRDAAGKGGAIKRITRRLNPRVARVASTSPK